MKKVPKIDKLALRTSIANFFPVTRSYSLLTIEIIPGKLNLCVNDTFEIFVIFEILIILEISNVIFGGKAINIANFFS